MIDGWQVWGEQYHAELSDILSVQQTLRRQYRSGLGEIILDDAHTRGPIEIQAKRRCF